MVQAASIQARIIKILGCAKTRIAWRRIGVSEGIVLAAITLAASALFGIIDQQFLFEREEGGSAVQIATVLGATILLSLFLRIMVGRLHDVGRTSAYLVLLLLLFPMTIYTYDTWLSNLPMGIFVVVVIIILILPGQTGRNRYGEPRPIAIRSVSLDLAVAGAAIIVAGLTATHYAFAGDEIYVGRQKYAKADIVSDNTLEGHIITQCYGFRGVSAYQDEGRGTFSRDGFQAGTFLFVLKPDSSLDIVFHGKDGKTSYKEDGFDVHYQGLSGRKQEKYSSPMFDAYDVDLSNLMVAAISRNADQKVVSMIQFSFGSYPDRYGYAKNRVLLTQTIRSESVMDPMSSVRGRLMIGNCEDINTAVRDKGASIPEHG